MKKFLSYTQTALSLIAIVLSIVAICVSYPRSADSGLDYMGFIVGILGVLVAILIGWQLFNSLNIKEYVDKAEIAKNEALSAKNDALAKVKIIESQIQFASQKLDALSQKIYLLETDLSNKWSKDELQTMSPEDIEKILLNPDTTES